MTRRAARLASERRGSARATPPPEGDPTDEAGARRKWYRRPAGVAGIIAATVIVGVSAVAGVLIAQAVSVRDDLDSARTLIATMQSYTTTGDIDALDAAAAEATERVSRAGETVQNPLWEAASVVPAVGANLRAITQLTATVQTLTTEALPPGKLILSKLSIDQIALADGGIDLRPFQESQASIPLVSAALAGAETQIAAIDTTDVLPAVAESVTEVRTFIEEAAPLLDGAQKYLPTLLDVAGSQGKKTYLVLVQNNAEVRATGGNPAASIIVQVDQGRVQILDQASSLTFYTAGTAGEQFTDLPPETRGLYPDTFALFSQDYTMTPDFPTTVRLFQDLWRQTNGDAFDGVISIDPVVLSHVLAVTGPVGDEGQQLTADNAVKTLLSDAYEQFPTGADSDAFFASVTRALFDFLTTARWDPTLMLGAMEQSASEQRLLLAFRDEAAQALVEEWQLDGALPADNTTSTQVGTYLNDYSVGKLEYHLRQSVSAVCDASARTITTTTSLTNDITPDIQSTYTLGERNPRFGYPRTSMMLDVLFFAPPGAQIVSTDPAEGDVTRLDRSGSQNGHTALSRLVVVGQGETRSVSSTIRLPDGALGPLELRHSPLASPTTVQIDESCSSLFPPAAP